ncbi:MAG: M3 family oligoendopeptidase [Deltaproteobacteria bacterium]|nr:M3 family oligoendopeptidase [Deltaproteobacteria bacterium]
MEKKILEENPYPRRFVPPDADMGQWSHIEPLFAALDSREVKTPPGLEEWLLHMSELASCIDQEGSRRYIAMTCQTDDPQAEKEYLHFVEEIEPRSKPWWQRLYTRFVNQPLRLALDRQRYGVLDRKIENQVRLFREENVPLEMEETKLSQQYQKITGAMTGWFGGREQTLQQLARYLEEPDRTTRKAAWEVIASRRLKDRERIEEIFDGLLALRARIARNAGFQNYREYAFRQRERFDYTPQDCLRFHKTVEEVAVPAARSIMRERRKRLGLDRLRPWDMMVDLEGRPPLRPFTKAEELIEGCHRIFRRINPEFGDFFALLRKKGLLDLESRKGKAPGGYQTTLSEVRLPFIFMNAVGIDRDVRTLLHESGHAFHTLECREEPLFFYREAPIEFCEVASMSMELLGAGFLDEFYTPEDSRRSYRDLLEEVITIFPWIATIDTFQHWLYTHENHTRAERRKTWLELQERFGGIEDWSGYEESLASLWQKQSHLFVHPFYYIEYGIAQLGALQVWRRSLRDFDQTIGSYRSSLSLGGSKPLPVLFQKAGIRFDFSRKAAESLMDTALEALRRAQKD